MHDTSNLQACLKTVAAQTQPFHQIILSDDSHADDRPEVQELCRQYGIEYLEFPFVNYAPAFGRKFNRSFAQTTGDAICLLCSNWVLGSNWVEEMARWLDELGPGHVVASDNARHKMLNAQGIPYDWFAGSPDRFKASNHHLIDEGFLTILHRQDWIPFPEAYDPPEDDLSATKGAWHAVIEWGRDLMGKQGVQLWIRRDLEAEHLPKRDPVEWKEQCKWSDGILQQRGAM